MMRCAKQTKIFIAIALNESIFLDVLHFPMKNIKSRDLEATFQRASQTLKQPNVFHHPVKAKILISICIIRHGNWDYHSLMFMKTQILLSITKALPRSF